jgi:dTDP-4-amino-4,6-dideoxygalactose transaminase
MEIFQAKKPIFTSLSPNVEKDDVALSLKLIFQPKSWQRGEAIEQFENDFKDYLGINYSFSFNSGRSALLSILEALKVGEEDEVLLQAFTCNAAVNPILEKGARPVFVDIDETLNLDPQDLVRKISSRSKVLMIQHTFGGPAKLDEILKIVKEKNLFLIEDCAHALGASYHGRLCGTFGDAAFFSFGRDKIISSVFGGMAVTNDEKIAQNLKEFQKRLKQPSRFWVFQQLLHPVLINYLVLPAFSLNNGLGGVVLRIFQKASLLSKAVYEREKRGKLGKYFPKLFPNALAILAQNQFKKLEKFNDHRIEIANFYQRELKGNQFGLPLALKENVESVFMRYPVLVNFDTDKILKEARSEKIFLNDGWRKSAVVPPDTVLEKAKYVEGSCPRAEKVAQNIINLPTHINISKKEAKRIVDFFKKHGG